MARKRTVKSTPIKLFLESRGYSPSNWSDSVIAITDTTLPNYSQIAPDWSHSNPKG